MESALKLFSPFICKRPLSLTLLCILSVSGIAFSVGFGLENYQLATKNSDLQYVYFSSSSILLAKSWMVITLLNLMIAIGVFFMWMKQRMGFLLYVLGETGQVLLPFYFLGKETLNPVAMIPVIVSMIMITFYSMNLKYME